MQILKAGNKDNWLHNNMRVSFHFNYTCNFSCSYCLNHTLRAHKLNVKLDIQAVEKVLDDIFSLNREHYNFSIAGGEPTLYKDLPTFFTLLQKQDKSIREKISVLLLTNGSKLDKIEDCFESAKDIKIKVHLSIHDEQKSIEEYKKLIQKFKYPQALEIKIIVPPNQSGDVLNLKDYFESLGCEFRVNAVITERKVFPHYTQEEIDFLDSVSSVFPPLFADIQKDDTIETCNFTRYNFLIEEKLSDYRGLYCSAGYANLNINPEGKVYRCFNDKTGVNFSIYEDSILNYPNLKKIRPCASQHCICPPLMALPKWRESTHTHTHTHTHNDHITLKKAI